MNVSATSCFYSLSWDSLLYFEDLFFIWKAVWWKEGKNPPSDCLFSQCSQWLFLGQFNARTWNYFGVSHMTGRDPINGVASCCFARHINNELTGKQGNITPNRTLIWNTTQVWHYQHSKSYYSKIYKWFPSFKFCFFFGGGSLFQTSVFVSSLHRYYPILFSFISFPQNSYLI